jgi:hypothetical protein
MDGRFWVNAEWIAAAVTAADGPVVISAAAGPGNNSSRDEEKDKHG